MIARKNDYPSELLKEMNTERIYESTRSLAFVAASAKTERISQEEYDQLVEPYREAMTRLEVRMNGLNEDYRKKYRDYPIHNIQARIKGRKSIEKKLAYRELPITAYAAKDNLTDIAGIRVICYFVEDIFSILSLVRTQTDLLILKESDYIHYPKSSGYKSYHMVLGVPVCSITLWKFSSARSQWICGQVWSTASATKVKPPMKQRKLSKIIPRSFPRWSGA